MEKVIFKTLLPVLAGFASVLVFIMIIKSFSSNSEINIYDSFFTLFIPILLAISLLIQYFIFLPFLKKIKEKSNNRKNIFILIASISMLMGLLSAIFFKEENTGSAEFFNLFIISSFCFLIYMLTDIFFVKTFE